jgi:carbon storage regulator CsrA
MLVLTRKAQESVVIAAPGTSGPLITITVIAVAGGRVKLAFEGDAAVPIHRGEVWQRINGGLNSPTPDPASPGGG